MREYFLGDLFLIFFFFFNKKAADSKQKLSSGTCRAPATVRGRFHGDRCHVISADWTLTSEVEMEKAVLH